MHKCLGAFGLDVYWKEVTFDFLYKIKDWNLVTIFYFFYQLLILIAKWLKLFFTYPRRPSPMV
jgi:hypothetical protein